MATRSSGLSPQEEISQGRELGWDVIAFHPVEDASKEKSESRRKAIENRNHLRANFVWRLKQIGLIVAKQKSSDRSDIIYKIAAPTHVLEPHAELIEMEMKSKFVDAKSGRNLYREFTREDKDSFLSHGPRFFTSLERSRLIFSLIEESIEKGGAGINLDKLQNEEKALDIFPLHDPEVKEALAAKWLSWNKIDSALAYSWELIKDFYRLQPLDDIRDYFGEKFALYFAWLDWYNLFLKPLSILGLLIFLVQMGYGLDYSNIATVIYAVVLCIWCTLFCEAWKRRESTLAFYWDVQDFEEEERIRPEFVGPKKPGVYTHSGQWVDLEYKVKEGVEAAKVPHNTYFNPWHRFSRVAASLSVLAVFLFALVVGTFAILAFRVFVQAADRAGAIGGGILAGILNAVFIIIMNQIYNKIALDMNHWENHRTDTAFEDRLIAKQFSFKFVNSYASLAFIAFAKDEPIPSWLSNLDEDKWPEEFSTPHKIFGMDIGRCKGVSCMSELFTQLMTLQITMIFVSNITEIVIPFIKKKMKVRSEEKGAKAHTTSRTTVQPVDDEPPAEGAELAYFELEMSSPTHAGVLEEYTEMMIQFGYVTLFACAFPLSSLCALLNNIIEIKVDGFKLLYATRRPRYQGAEDIGTWQAVLEFMSLVSVISNCAIICFTSGVFKGNIVNREGAKYSECSLKCNNLYGAPTQQELSSFDALNWTQVAYLGDRLSDYSRCLTGCACYSPIGTCYKLSDRVWIFVVSEHVILGFKLLLAYLIPDKPAWVEEAEARDHVERDLKHWDPSHKHQVDESTLQAWEQGEDNTDVWDNEVQRAPRR